MVLRYRLFKVLYLFLSPSEQLPLTLKLFTCDKDDVFLFFFNPVYLSVLQTEITPLSQLRAHGFMRGQ